MMKTPNKILMAMSLAFLMSFLLVGCAQDNPDGNMGKSMKVTTTEMAPQNMSGPMDTMEKETMKGDMEEKHGQNMEGPVNAMTRQKMDDAMDTMMGDTMQGETDNTMDRKMQDNNEEMMQ